jgi:RimJ/RimL family protein N-acetyltransferase
MVEEEHKMLCIETSPAPGQPGALIGDCALHRISSIHHNAELGIVIVEKDYWSKGYGGDAIKTLLRYAFDELYLHKVYLRVFSFNPRAMRCYEKCGFQVEGRLIQQLFRHGAWHDEVYMGVLRDDFLKRST